MIMIGILFIEAFFPIISIYGMILIITAMLSEPLPYTI